jgi:hypothetical protein
MSVEAKPLLLDTGPQYRRLSEEKWHLDGFWMIADEGI